MQKTYDPQAIEQYWYQIWEKEGYFQAQGFGQPYCIMLPPPNVTGTLHMGHGFQDTLMDVLIRYHRMQGLNTLWQLGTDHAGIATQMVVERKLLAQKIKRQDIGREQFLKHVWQWVRQSESTIKQQLRRMGASGDWLRERFMLDDGICHTVQKAFIELYEKGLIYRGKRLVNWDPVLLTAISDLEVVATEEQGSLYFIRYPMVKNTDYIVVATTRPETLLGDVAVAVHPEDERYKKFIGESLSLPFTKRTIPIIADAMVDPTFGTGCVKITPAHDFQDYAFGQRHNLPLINIFTPQAKLNENVPVAYRGLDRYVARDKLLIDLEKAQLLEKVEPHILKVPRGDRSGQVIEPYLTDQWFVKMKPLAEPAIAMVKNGDIKFVPENWHRTYLQWLENIEDWCISRQLWWGHRIPVWYDDNGKIFVGHDEKDIRNSYKLARDVNLTQDEDVLDTWFSSALWPFATLGWPDETPELQTFYPSNVLVTGFDIIFFWVARMVMLGLNLTGKIPFKEVYVTGLVRDAEGQKMSKSKGNTLDPIDLVDGISLDELIKKRTSGLMQPEMQKKIYENTKKEFPDGIIASGTDALRFTYCALATHGRDIRWDQKRLEGYRNFCNKLWNAARYVLMNTENYPLDDKINLSLPDIWIRSKLQSTIREVRQHINDYRFDLLAQTLYEFTWNEYCDWYLEFSKPILNNDAITKDLQAGARQTLVMVFESLLRLIHPLMPFITEEIWQKIKPLLAIEQKTIMLAAYPTVDEDLINEEAEIKITWLKKIIVAIRNIRSEMNISHSKQLTLLFSESSPISDQSLLEENKGLLQSLLKLTAIGKTATKPSFCAMALVGELELFIPLTDIVDKNAEITRLKKEINKLQAELQRSQGKMANDQYIAKAPAIVVAKERSRLAELEAAINKLQKIADTLY